MIKFENVKVEGFEPAIRGMRNPKNSWDRSDSHVGLSGDEWSLDPGYIIGNADKELMMKLSKGGPVHAKYRRMIVVWCDITAPSYWWAEFDTYRFGRERNSCSFMHKGTSKPFEIVDFSFDEDEIRAAFMDIRDNSNIPELVTDGDVQSIVFAVKDTWEYVLETLNKLRDLYLKTKDDRIFQMIRRLLPSGYNIRATIMMNYEVLANAYHWRKNHRLDEWRAFCKWAETLPYSWIFTADAPGTEIAQPVKPAKTVYGGIMERRFEEDTTSEPMLRDLTEKEADIYDKWILSEATDTGETLVTTFKQEKPNG